MDASAKIAVALVVLNLFQILVWTTVLYAIRRWYAIEPVWGWGDLLRRVFLLFVVTTALFFVPFGGPFAAVILSLIVVRRLSGMDLLSTYMLSFFMGAMFLVLMILAAKYLQLDFVPGFAP